MSGKYEKDSIAVLITKDGMGNGDPQLQRRLLKSYLALLLDNNVLPTAICFYTEGVKLVIDGSPLLEELKSLEEKGVWLVVCQTCLNHYDLMDKVRVGVVGGMTDIIEVQWRAEKVITI